MCHSAFMDLINITRVREMAKQDNMSCGMIAADQHVDQKLINLFMKKHDINIDYPSLRRRSALIRKPSVYVKLDVDEVRKQAKKPGSSLTSIADTLKVSYAVIAKFTKKHNILVNKRMKRSNRQVKPATIHLEEPCARSVLMGHFNNTSARISIASLINP